MNNLLKKQNFHNSKATTMIDTSLPIGPHQVGLGIKICDSHPGDLLWHEQRQTGFGGTDIGALLGVNPWRGPEDVYREKTSCASLALAQPCTPQMRRGKEREEAILAEYARITVTKVIHINATYRGRLPWQICSPDGAAINDRDEILYPIEAKWTKNQRYLSRLPEMYILQVLHYLDGCGMDEGVVVVEWEGDTGETGFAVHTIRRTDPIGGRLGSLTYQQIIPFLEQKWQEISSKINGEGGGEIFPTTGEAPKMSGTHPIEFFAGGFFSKFFDEKPPKRKIQDTRSKFQSANFEIDQLNKRKGGDAVG